MVCRIWVLEADPKAHATGTVMAMICACISWASTCETRGRPDMTCGPLEILLGSSVENVLLLFLLLRYWKTGVQVIDTMIVRHLTPTTF